MKIKTSELIGRALDWAVWSIGYIVRMTPAMKLHLFRTLHNMGRANSSIDWAQGGPIVEELIKEGFHLDKAIFSEGRCKFFRIGKGEGCPPIYAFGESVLIAACRTWVAFKLGDEVDVPEELLPTKPCRSPYCECQPGQCSHPGFHDARET